MRGHRRIIVLQATEKSETVIDKTRLSGILIYNLIVTKGNDGESTFQLNVSASRGWCKPGTSNLNPKITPELRTERVI